MPGDQNRPPLPTWAWLGFLAALTRAGRDPHGEVMIVGRTIAAHQGLCVCVRACACVYPLKQKEQ